MRNQVGKVAQQTEAREVLPYGKTILYGIFY